MLFIKSKKNKKENRDIKKGYFFSSLFLSVVFCSTVLSLPVSAADYVVDSNFVGSTVSGTASLDFGYASTAGDFNADGYDDVAISYIDDTGTKTHGVYIFYGPRTDVLTKNTALNISATASSSVEQITATAGKAFGTSLAAGDVNGDGVDDLVVGAPKETVSTKTGAGRVSIFYGDNTNGLISSTKSTDILERDLFFTGSTVSDNAGASIAVYDVNNDSIDDILIGVPGHDTSSSDEGKMSLVYGSSALSGGVLSSKESAKLFGSLSNEYLGSVVGAGDFDKDGSIDIIAGGKSSTSNGSKLVYGSSSAFSGTLTEDATFYGVGTGFTVEDIAIGDYNADGYDDIAFGASNYGSSTGIVNVWLGSSTQLSGGSDYKHFYFFGVSGDMVGGKNSMEFSDINGDGYDDLIVGASGYDSAASDEGAVAVLYGDNTVYSTSSPTRYDFETDADDFFVGATTSGNFGFGVGTADVNGDGFTEIIAGAPNAGTYGKAYILYFSVDRDGDSVLNPYIGMVTGDDCNDDNSAASTEVTYYRDSDGDGYTDPDYSAAKCEDEAVPAGYAVENGDDCDDSDVLKYQNGTFYADSDGDGVGAGSAKTVCYGTTTPAGYATTNTDACPSDSVTTTQLTYYTDSDGDGYAGSTTVLACPSAASAYYSATTDCDDGDSSKYQNGTFYVDSDGDGIGAGSAKTVCFGASAPSGYATTNTDACPTDSSTTTKTTWYRDADGDGYGDMRNTQDFCPSESTTGYVANDDDTDDTNASIPVSGGTGGDGGDTGTGGNTGTGGDTSTQTGDGSTNATDETNETDTGATIEEATVQSDGSVRITTAQGIVTTAVFDDGETPTIFLSTDGSVLFAVNNAGTRVRALASTGDILTTQKINKKRQAKKKVRILKLKKNKTAIVVLTKKKGVKRLSAVVYHPTKESFVKVSKQKMVAAKKSVAWKITKKKKVYRIVVKDAPKKVFTLSRKTGVLKKK